MVSYITLWVKHLIIVADELKTLITAKIYTRKIKKNGYNAIVKLNPSCSVIKRISSKSFLLRFELVFWFVHADTDVSHARLECTPPQNFSSLKQALKSYFSSIMLQGCSIILEIYKWMLNITCSIDAIYIADILATNFVIRWSFMLFLIPEEMTRNLVQKFNIPFLKIYFIQVVLQLRNLEWVSDARSHFSLLRFPGIFKVNGYTCRFTAVLTRSGAFVTSLL